MPVTIEKAPPIKKAAASASSTPKLSKALQEKADAANGLGQIGQAICLMFGKHADAGAIKRHWPGISIEAAKLSETNERVNAAFEKLMIAGPFGALIAAALPFGIQLAVNHGRIPMATAAGMEGIVSPATLENEVKAEILKAEKESMEAMLEAQREKAEIERAWNEHLAEQAQVVAMAGNATGNE